MPAQVRPVSVSTSHRGLRSILVAGACAALLAGCTATPAAPSATGTPKPTGYHGLPISGAAEPGTAPPVTVKPVGRVVALPAGSHPWGVAVVPDVGEVYVAPRHKDDLIAVDLKSHAVRTVAVPGSARMIDLAGPHGPLLLPGEDTNTVSQLAVPSLKVESSATTHPHPHQAVAVGTTTFVSEENGHAIAVIRGGEVVKRLPEPVSPGGITAAAGRVAAVDVHTNTLFVWDSTTLKLLAALPAGKGPSHVVPIGGSRVAVCDVRGDAVLTYDLGGTKPKALGRAAVPGRAFWIRADPATDTVYTALANTNKIAKLHVDAAGRPTLIATVPTVRNPISMDLETGSGTLYVAGYADSQLQIFPTSAFGGSAADQVKAAG